MVVCAVGILPGELRFSVTHYIYDCDNDHFYLLSPGFNSLPSQQDGKENLQRSWTKSGLGSMGSFCAPPPSSFHGTLQHQEQTCY